MGFPTIYTPRLILREITLMDEAAVFAIFSDAAVTRYYDVKTMKSVTEAKKLIKWWNKRIATQQALRWGVALTEDGPLIGTCGFSELNLDKRLGEIGCDLAQSYWGRGFMTEALREVLRFGFEQLNLNRIETWIMVENAASIRVIEKIGMRREGTLREREYWNDKFNDVEMFALLKREWPAEQA